MPSWPPAVRAVFSSLLAATLVLTGVVPGWEVDSQSTGRTQRATYVGTIQTVSPTLHTSVGVPAARAASFNDEQKAIAETWVSLLRVEL